MPTYAIGDVQGCYQELLDLLAKIKFNADKDRLWFTGDLVNRGPDSLEVLRFARSVNAVSVLGNHECHLMAIAAGVASTCNKDTINDILLASDREELLEWIRSLPFLYRDPDYGYAMVHAGLPPQWDLEKAASLSRELEGIFRSDDVTGFLENMYGNGPKVWDDNLEGYDRLRFIVNAFTRMRYCDEDGVMNFRDKGPPGSQAKTYKPWFEISSRRSRFDRIIFGHWASLHDKNPGGFRDLNVFPLDTGCVWGRELTAMSLDTGNFYSVPSRQ